MTASSTTSSPVPESYPQAFLIGLKLLAEVMADLPNGHPGCLIASICYQERLFDREVRDLTARSVEA